MKRYWLLVTASALVAVSAVIYLIHYLVFHDPHHIFLYLVGDIAFVPIEVLLVVIVIERLLARHERRERRQKLNMIIGTFFSELGMQLLGVLNAAVRNAATLRPHLAVDAGWSARKYQESLAFVERFAYDVEIRPLDLPALRRTLVARRDFMVLLLASPGFMEHERFADLLQGIFHLLEELAARETLDELPDADLAHLAGDVRRVYSRLTGEWLLYCRHLQQEYPYIFSIVVRTHPLQEEPSPVVRG